MRNPAMLAACATAWVAFGCSTSFTGGTSLTLMSRQDLGAYYEPVAERVERAECFNNVLLLAFFGNAGPSHASAVDHILDQYDADVLLDAQASTEIWPFVLFNRVCSKVAGVPARRRDQGAGVDS